MKKVSGSKIVDTAYIIYDSSIPRESQPARFWIDFDYDEQGRRYIKGFIPAYKDEDLWNCTLRLYEVSHGVYNVNMTLLIGIPYTETKMDMPIGLFTAWPMDGDRKKHKLYMCNEPVDESTMKTREIGR